MTNFKYVSNWDCSINQDLIAPSGTTVVLPDIWSRTIDGGLTPTKDISIILSTDTTYGDALAIVELAALRYLKEHGSGKIRQYTVEGAVLEEGVLTFELGSL